MKQEGPLPCSQEPAIGPYLEIVEPRPYLHISFQFIKFHFNIILPFNRIFPEWSLPFMFFE